MRHIIDRTHWRVGINPDWRKKMSPIDKRRQPAILAAIITFLILALAAWGCEMAPLAGWLSPPSLLPQRA